MPGPVESHRSRPIRQAARRTQPARRRQARTCLAPDCRSRPSAVVPGAPACSHAAAIGSIMSLLSGLRHQPAAWASRPQVTALERVCRGT